MSGTCYASLRPVTVPTMHSSQENTHVFIVRIWSEPREVRGAQPEWRGVIEHAAGDARRFFRTLDEVTAFIALHLPAGAMAATRGARRVLDRLRSKWSW